MNYFLLLLKGLSFYRISAVLAALLLAGCVAVPGENPTGEVPSEPALTNERSEGSDSQGDGENTNSDMVTDTQEQSVPQSASQNSPQDSPQELDSEVNPFNEPPEEIVYGHFDRETLERVILAEMAGQRGLDQLALDEYMALARDTLDLGIIKRASRIATFMRDARAALAMSELWLELEPDSDEAIQTLAEQMLAMGRYRDSLDAMETLLNNGHLIDFRIVPRRLDQDENAGLFRDSLIGDMLELSTRHPEDQSLRLALAQLYQQNDQTEESYELVRALGDELENPAEIILLEVELLRQLGRINEIEGRLKEGVDRVPDNLMLRFEYGRSLISRGDFEVASEQFQHIVDLDPNDLDMIYSLALINLEMNHLKDAQEHFESLTGKDHRSDDVHYYLGYIHNQFSETEQAIEQYQQVSGGTNFMQAQSDLANLLIQEKRYPEARRHLQRQRYTSPEYNLPLLTLEASVLLDNQMEDDASDLLNSSLIAFPDNIQLLYLRSLLSTRRDELPLIEKDLRRIIELEPNNPDAYNSLGYYLADNTERIDEAYELILKANELAPGNPAIIDSLGWVQYRLGMLEEARRNLESAFELFPDHEVAAHLGEVLWVMGERREANKIWQDALREFPESSYILEAMERLKQ